MNNDKESNALLAKADKDARDSVMTTLGQKILDTEALYRSAKNRQQNVCATIHYATLRTLYELRAGKINTD